MADKDDLRNEVIKNIRSLCLTEKGPTPVRQLTDDYRAMIGQKIPFQELGFKKLEDFLQSEITFKVSWRGNDLVIKAEPTAKSAHIADMVSKQKTSKKKISRVHFNNYRSTHNNYQQTSKWRPKSNNSSHYRGSVRPQAVSHTQFVNRGKTPTVASKVVIPEHSTFHSEPSQVEKFDLNQRLTNRLKENKTAPSNNNYIHPQPSNGIHPQLTQDNHTKDRKTEVLQPPEQKSKLLPTNHTRETVLTDIDDTVNPLLATRRRITKKMSELSLERDSGNSSPTSETPVPKTPECVRTDNPCGNSSPTSETPVPKAPEFVRTNNPLADLKLFAEIHNLGEVVVNVTQIKAKRNQFYSCKIKVGQHDIYSSYPEDFHNPLDSQNFCCNKALDDLIPKKAKRKKSLMISSDIDILERIPPMLEKHTRGVWAWQLKLDYTDKYNEVLPDDWIKIIDRSSSVEIDKMGSEDYILYHCAPGTKGQLVTSRPSVCNVSVPSNTVQFSEDGNLIGQVTCAMSVNEIWCQQIKTEESKSYLTMMDRLQIYYQGHESELTPKTISPAGYYIAKLEDEYFRVRTVKINEDEETVECFFIDFGDEVNIPKCDIFELTREYASVQAQAFVCRLCGLEYLYDITGNSESLSLLYNTEVVIEMASDSTAIRSSSEVLPVYMYDSEGHSINEKLIPELTKELASLNLQKDTIVEVYISNIEPNGDVYVQVRNQGYDYYTKLHAQIEEQLKSDTSDDNLCKVTRENSKGKLFFWQRELWKWFRIELIDWSPLGDLAQVYLVDHGSTDVIDVSKVKLYPLDKINDIFSTYPHLAVKIRIALEKIPSDFVELASKDMAVDQPVLLKIIGSTEDNIPLAELFKRNSDGGLFCINKSISIKSEMQKKTEDVNLKEKFKYFSSTGNVPSTGYLQSPPLPEKGTYFEVCIPFAVNPYNFFIQPLSSKPQLDQMMEDIQNQYRNTRYSNLKCEDILPGNIYASKHNDGFWYRTSVIKVIHSGSVSVFFCDFGYYQTVPVKQLIPLDDKFLRLPHQALKAKLADVKPIQSKWTMEGCDEFKKLIEKKEFIALFIDIEKDILYQSDSIVKVLLVDTSTDVDIHIGKELVKRGIAVEETIQQ